MKQDRFDEFYMKQTQAKAHEKNNLSQKAWALYSEIVSDYFPDTDFSFQRLVILSEKLGKKEQLKEICELAISRIQNGEMRGDMQFFKLHLDKLTSEQTEVSAAQTRPKDWQKKLLFIGYLAIAIVLSLPFKLAKLIFLIAIGISVWLLFEIVKRVREEMTIKWHSIALSASLVALLLASLQIPPPEWTSFFSLQTLSQIGNQSVINQTTSPDEQSPATIEDSHLTTLEQMMSNHLLIDHYQIVIKDKQIGLTVYLKASVNADEAKRGVDQILSELNSIMGYPAESDRLGELYQSYTAYIEVYNSFNQLLLTGETSRFTQRVKWK